ncbi:GNAT family N-acetyltransferase [Shewanella inventionis]|uniref:GNAT family N-acetyltransferase n=1 Tax=Shewanella inventionis TaxID=1738770 RepID=A0ABQ1JXH4_9GAMM|nr:GNAT family N-acetyltransferase [Shewanella inventionis]MCL1160130.1 GNAT family N-acetyltransferase [Shewanella inventionis]UAL43187.1 GNAT family N-acetyltransferase [Shewanella inventionis]GGB77488.1 GNAT family N-acetyltransferase [Shewanella inventionis]
MSLTWLDVGFNEFTLEQLYNVLQLRVDVFVVEQNCPYSELDGKDKNIHTRHLLGVDEQQNVVAYCRILAPNVSYPQASIGRVAIAKTVRGQGLAYQLMQHAIAIANKHWPDDHIQIGAQDYLRHFYQQLGFVVNSEVYLEDGIPHLDMLLNYS